MQTVKRYNPFYDLSLFRICYAISLMFELVAIHWIELMAGYINGLIFIWGIFLSLHTMFNDSEKFRIDYKNLAFLFVANCFLSSIFNFSSNILLNLITSVNNFMCIFLFLGMNYNTEKEKIEREINFLFKSIIFFACSMSIIGIYILFKFGSLQVIGHNLGIYKNRFFGICTNPNQLGFISVISIFSCDILSDKYTISRFKINKILISICVIINFITLFLTDSNASFVFITVYTVIRIFYENFSKYDKLKDINFSREIIFAFACISVIVSGSFLIRMGCQKLVNKVVSIQNVNKHNNHENAEKLKQRAPTKDFNKDLRIGRGEHEISSGRIVLFKQGIKLSRIHPLIGIGRENIAYYGNFYIKGGLAFPCKHPDLHNLYLTLIVSYGWIGFILFSAFILLTIYKVAYVVFIRTHNMNSKLISKVFAVIIAYFSYANFEVGIMSGISLSDILIWFYIGYAIALISDYPG